MAAIHLMHVQATQAVGDGLNGGDRVPAGFQQMDVFIQQGAGHQGPHRIQDDDPLAAQLPQGAEAIEQRLVANAAAGGRAETVLLLQTAQLGAVRTGDHHHIDGLRRLGCLDDVFDHHLAANTGVLLGHGCTEACAHAAGEDQGCVLHSATSSGMSSAARSSSSSVASSMTSSTSSLVGWGSSPLRTSIIRVPAAV